MFTNKDEVIIWLKQREISALEQSHRHENSHGDGYFNYWQGKAAGFADAWQFLVFDGDAPTPDEYNAQNEYWSEVASEF